MGLLLPASWSLLTWLTPRSVIEDYVCPPYFSEFEAVAYRYFPTSLIRTMLFSMAISVPICRRIRNLGDLNKQVPLWFNLACRFYVYGILGYSFVCVFAMIGLALVAEYGGNL
jgi:hypothetical protein